MVWKCLAASLLLATAASAQDEDPAALKSRILEKVREKLAADRKALLQRVEKIIDEELSGKAPEPAPAPKPAPPAVAPPAEAGKVRDLEKKLKALEDQKEAIQAELAKLRREAEDEAVRREARREGPNDLIEAQALFQEGLEAHEAKKFDRSIRLFKRIYYQFPEEVIGFTSAYNVACGYALAGRKDEALDWLELSVRKGFNKFDHMRQDSDLDSLRDETRYKKLLIDR